MGTNYYLYREAACGHCGHRAEPLHIGKSSAGWCFALHVIPEEGLDSLDAWKVAWSSEGTGIEDEYGRIITPQEMEGVVMRRAGMAVARHEAGFLAENHAIDGPRGLLRHDMDGTHCVGHGDGTWDLIAGEFS